MSKTPLSKRTNQKSSKTPLAQKVLLKVTLWQPWLENRYFQFYANGKIIQRSFYQGVNRTRYLNLMRINMVHYHTPSPTLEVEIWYFSRFVRKKVSHFTNRYIIHKMYKTYLFLHRDVTNICISLFSLGCFFMSAYPHEDKLGTILFFMFLDFYQSIEYGHFITGAFYQFILR